MAQYEHLPIYKKAMGIADHPCQQLLIDFYGEHSHA